MTAYAIRLSDALNEQFKFPEDITELKLLSNTDESLSLSTLQFLLVIVPETLTTLDLSNCSVDDPEIFSKVKRPEQLQIIRLSSKLRQHYDTNLFRACVQPMLDAGYKVHIDDSPLEQEISDHQYGDLPQVMSMSSPIPTSEEILRHTVAELALTGDELAQVQKILASHKQDYAALEAELKAARDKSSQATQLRAQSEASLAEKDRELSDVKSVLAATQQELLHLQRETAPYHNLANLRAAISRKQEWAQHKDIQRSLQELSRLEAEHSDEELFQCAIDLLVDVTSDEPSPRAHERLQQHAQRLQRSELFKALGIALAAVAVMLAATAVTIATAGLAAPVSVAVIGTAAGAGASAIGSGLSFFAQQREHKNDAHELIQGYGY